MWNLGSGLEVLQLCGAWEAALRCYGGAGPGKEVFVNSKNRLTEVWR